MRLDGSSAYGVELVMSQGTNVFGRVLGLEFEDFPQLQIMAMQPGASTNPAIAAVDYDGNYRFENLPTGDWVITAMLGGRSGRQVRETVTLDPGLTGFELDLEFGGGYSITGQILIDGEPGRGSFVAAVGVDSGSSAQGRTDQDGTFSLEGLDSGSYELMVASMGGLTGTHTEELIVEGDVERTINLQPVSIRGRVVDEYDGGAIDAAALSIEPLEEQAIRIRMGSAPPQTDATGSFRLDRVLPGEYRITASKDEYANATQDITVTEAGDIEGVVLKLTPSSGLTLYVTNSAGAPVETVEVAALDPSGQPILLDRIGAGEGGRIRVQGLPAGNWPLIVSSQGQAATRMDVRAPGEPVSVVLPPAGGLRITVPPLEGQSDKSPGTAERWARQSLPNPQLRPPAVRVDSARRQDGPAPDSSRSVAARGGDWRRNHCTG